MAASTVIVRAAASACVFRGAAVLLVQRAKPPYEGIWSLPGGSVEPGETARQAAQRELAEETGLVCQLAHPAGINDVILRDSDGSITTQYLIAAFAGRLDDAAPEPVAATDARAVRFVPLGELEAMRLGRRVTAIIEHAWVLVRDTSH